METSLAENRCWKMLHENQNPDGGWGFYSGSASRVEPTCWAVLALAQSEDSRRDASEGIARGRQFLRSAQLADGSWPAAPGQTIGCWVTSVACWALAASPKFSDAVAAGLEWIYADWPKDSGWWARMQRKLVSRKKKELTQQNDALRGWGWTPHTASWVEPTALALVATSQCSSHLLPKGARDRRELAKRMLCDRMCPGGGWNCGNPRTYGVDGEPLVVPTVWALLALRDTVERQEASMSLAWLKRSVSEIFGSGSLALARIGLGNFGARDLISDERLSEAFTRNESLRNTAVIAWNAIAWSKNRWPPSEILMRYAPQTAGALS